MWRGIVRTLTSLRTPLRRAAGRFTRLHCERLEERSLPSVTPQEQLFVYLVNRARHDPVAYQQEQSLPVSLASVTPRPPLAVNNDLFASSGFHAGDMASRNYFSHNTPEGLTPNQMIRNAGYPAASVFSANANYVESIAAGTFVDTAAESLNMLIVDEGVPSLGHRVHLLGMSSFFADHREIGIGHAYSGSATYRNYWAIHTAYSSTSDRFLTGVVFDDANGNARYDLNEGLSGVTVTVAGVGAVTTNAAGGWSLEVPAAGTYAVSASGGGFDGTSTADVTVGAANVEVDFISGEPNGYIDFAPSGPTPNRAPVLRTTGTIALEAVPEDSAAPAGQPLSALVGGFITDADADAVKGVAVTATAGDGAWQYSLNGGSTWTAFGATSAAAALLLPDAAQVRFVPSADTHGTATLTFRAWDQTSGEAGGRSDLSAPGATGGGAAFSTAVRSAALTVTPVNDAPVFTAAPSSLPATFEDRTSRTVSVGSLFAAAITDVDERAMTGVAVTGIVGLGSWQYSLDGGRTFRRIAAASGSAAVLLRSTDLVRFVPARDFNGTASLAARAWDRTRFAAGNVIDLTAAGTGGAAPFSVAVGTATLAVTPVNDAPGLQRGVAALSPVGVNGTGGAGDSVATLLGAADSDVDAGAARGIAVVQAVGVGTWWYSLDGGATWADFIASGAVSANAARLLPAQARVRFTPAPGYTLTASTATQPSLLFRAWDQTSGDTGAISRVLTGGGTSAFSYFLRRAIVRVNDAPVLTPRSLVMGPARPGRPFVITVAALLGPSLADAGTGTLAGVGVTAASSASGSWQYSTDGGRTYRSVGAPSEGAALLLRTTDRLRFIPQAGAVGSAPLTFRGWDRTMGVAGQRFDLTQPGTVGSRGAFSVGEDVATLTFG